MTRIGINGFGRIGRLALRAAWGREKLDFVHVNELKGGAPTAAYPVGVRQRTWPVVEEHRIGREQFLHRRPADHLHR